MEPMMPSEWTRLESRPVYQNRIFSLRQDRVVSPRTGEEHQFVIMESVDWVNSVALTDAGKIVLIRQWRPGTREISLEMPGGMVDPGESPREAAERELLEETGYRATKWTALGSVDPNPAIQANHCHTFLAEGAVRVGAPEQDSGEDIETIELPVEEVERAIASGRIRHALICCAFQRFDLHRRGIV
jgi:8-oxo-dGTP pyrophosphatase MutT (NUDIX family)